LYADGTRLSNYLGNGATHTPMGLVNLKKSSTAWMCLYGLPPPTLVNWWCGW
jgi:hypothetical protein